MLLRTFSRFIRYLYYWRIIFIIPGKKLYRTFLLHREESSNSTESINHPLNQNISTLIKLNFRDKSNLSNYGCIKIKNRI